MALPNQLYLSYSEENPDSFKAGQTPKFYQNSKVSTIYSQYLRMCSQKTTFKKKGREFFLQVWYNCKQNNKQNSSCKQKYPFCFRFQPLFFFSKMAYPFRERNKHYRFLPFLNGLPQISVNGTFSSHNCNEVLCLDQNKIFNFLCFSTI